MGRARTQYVRAADRGDGTGALATVIMPITRCGGASPGAGVSEVRAKKQRNTRTRGTVNKRTLRPRRQRGDGE